MSKIGNMKGSGFLMDIPCKTYECYNRLIKYLINLEFDNLMDYTLDSQSGYDIVQFYKDLAEQSIGVCFIVTSEEISDGKYKIKFNPESENSYILYSKAWFNTEDVAESILQCLIIPFLKDNFSKSVTSEINSIMPYITRKK